MIKIVKRTGHSEDYDSKKLYASIYATCLSIHEPAAAVELFAQKVVEDTENWLAKKTEVTANDIRREAGKHLSLVNPHAGYLYLHHRIMG
jgi:hypothetical protein